jgi:hypothetical protein
MTPEHPDYVTRLEAAYGGPSQQGFGSAVFFETLSSPDDLAQASLATYKTFVGPLWDRYGEQAWMGTWREVHARKADATPNIVAELRDIADSSARRSVPMLLDDIDGAEAARAALSAAFDDPGVTELRTFNLGDGEAMSGLLIAGRRGANGETTCVVFLMD